MLAELQTELRAELRAVRTALEAVARDFDAARLSGPESITVLTELGVIHRLAGGLAAKAAKRVDDTAAHTHRGDRSAAELASRVLGVSTGEARRAIDTAARLETLPATDAAVRAGKVSAAQADLIVAGASADPGAEPELLRAAHDGLVRLRDAVIAARARREDETARSARRQARRATMWTAADGMVELHARFPPETGGAIRARLDTGVRRRFREARAAGEPEPHDTYAADELAEAILGTAATEKAVGYTTHVVIDFEALQRGHVLDGETCEIPGVGPVNVEWVRSVLGQSFVTAIVKRGRDIRTVAHLGRHVPAELRTAMLVSGRECVVEGCTGRDYLELDHCEIDHARGGPTARWNLAWMCSVDHRRKSQGWRLGPPHPTTGKRRLDPPAASGRAA